MNENLFGIKIINFLIFSTFAILLPYLPLLLSERGFNTVHIGFLLMAGPFFATFSQPIVGFISDKLNETRKTLIILWFLTGVCTFLLFYIKGVVVSVILIICLFTFFLSAIPLVDTLTVRIARDLSSTYSNIRIWGSIGFCIVAVFFGLFFENIGGLTSLVYIYSLIWIIALVVLFSIKDKAKSNDQTSITLKDLTPILNNKTLLLFLLFLLFLAVPHRMNDALFSIYYKELGANDSLVSWAWAVIGLSEIIGFYLSVGFIKKYQPLHLIVVSSFIYVVRWICYVYFTDPYLVLGLQFFQALTYSLFWASAVNYINESVSERFRATSQSLLSMVFLGVSGLIGGSVGGLIQHKYGGSSMYLFALVSALLAFLGFLLLAVKLNHQPIKDRTISK